jgi:hypothetical protein
MNLNRLALTNWRNIEALDIPLARINIFRGGNAQGKSSIRDGIEYLLTGRCEGTDARGEGAIKLIREGAEKASLEADLQGQEVISIRATLTEKSGRTPKFAHKTDPTYPVENVKGWLEKQKPVLSCLLNSRHFIKLDAGDQKKLLASIILPESYEWPEEIKNKCNAVHIASLIPWDAAPFDVIEKAYEIAFNKRRDLNRDLKNLHVPEAIQPPAGYGDVEAVRARLTQLRQQVSHLESERRAGERARGEAESKQRVLEARIEGFEAAIGSEQRVLEGIDAKLLSAKQVKDLQVVAGNEKKLAKIEKDIAALREQIAGVNALLKQFDALDGKNACPTCKRDVTDEWLTQAMSPHIDRKNVLMNDEHNLLKQMQELGDVEGAKRKLEEQKQIAADEARAKSLVNEKSALLRASREELAGDRSADTGDRAEEERQLREQITRPRSRSTE